MSFPALLYTAAAVAFFILMINRPAVEIPGTTMQEKNATSEQADSADAMTATAGGQTDAADSGSMTATDEQDGSATQSDNSGSNDSAAQTDASASSADAGSAGDSDQSGSASSDADATSGDGNSADEQTDSDSSAQETDNGNAEDSNTEADSDTQAATTSSSNTQQAIAAAATSTASADSGTQASAQPDYARERRISNEIRDAVLEGDIFYLNDGNRSFMSIQTNADERRGGALILHGRGFHPDWEDTVYPLRTGLAENGWTTLSLQMPVLAKDAKYNDYVPLFAEAGKRIQAGIRHLKQQGISPITIVAHSCGAHMAMQWIRDNGDADIAAYVGLGMGATDFGQKMAEPFPLDKMKVPVFDVYGENDFPAVIKMAPDRWTQITTAGNAKSEQRILPEADHYFKDKGDELVGVVSTWLNGL